MCGHYLLNISNAPFLSHYLDHNGKLSINELTSALKEANPGVPRVQRREWNRRPKKGEVMVSQHDGLSPPVPVEAVQDVDSLLKQCTGRRSLLTQWAMMRPDVNYTVNFAGFKRGILSHGIRPSPQDALVLELFNKFDLDNNRRLSYPELVRGLDASTYKFDKDTGRPTTWNNDTTHMPGGGDFDVAWASKGSAASKQAQVRERERETKRRLAKAKRDADTAQQQETSEDTVEQQLDEDVERVKEELNA